MDERRRTVSRPARLAVRGAAPAPAAGEDEYAAQVEQPVVAAAELERAAARVRGVHSCRVLLRPGERLPAVVRLVAQGERRTAVAKDVQSAWFALWGLYVPRRCFVVTALRGTEDLGLAPRRLQLSQLSFDRSGAEVTATVTLAARGRTLQGRAALPSAGPAVDVRRLAAEAVLVALREVLPPAFEPDLLELRRVRVGGVLTLLCAVSGPRGEPLFGICRLRGDEREAAARSVLDAINRILPR